MSEGLSYKEICIGSPYLILQFSLTGFMTYYAGAEAYARIGIPHHEGGVGGHPFYAYAYTVWLAFTFGLAMLAFVKTFVTAPGHVTNALIEKLKQ
jgi:hypothetical protein